MNEEDRVAPVNVGETYDVSIDAVGEKGDGIAKIKGFVLFVAGVKKGDYVKVKITKVLKNVGFAQMVEKVDRPIRSSKFMTISQEEFKKPEAAEDKYAAYQDTDDFGEEEK